MITPLRSSTIRLYAGGGMAFLGVLVLLFALPQASRFREHSVKAAKDAAKDDVVDAEFTEVDDDKNNKKSA